MKWRTLFLSIMLEFHKLDDAAARSWAAQNFRQNVGQDYADLQRTAVQMIFLMRQWRATEEKRAGGKKLSVEAQVEIWNTHVKMSVIAEKVSKEFIAATSTVNDRLLGGASA